MYHDRPSQASERRPSPREDAASIGATEAVSTALPAIQKLRSEGVRWAAIAAALAEQGIFEGSDKRPISALVSQVVARDHASAERSRARSRRPDLVAAAPVVKPSVKLALALTASNKMDEPAITEEQIRRDQLSAIQHLVKPAAKK